MNTTALKVLILCTGNSARSIIGEYVLRSRGEGRFETYSAGAKPTGTVHPLALWVLKDSFGIDASGARSKSWDEFKNIKFDCVITVCDRAKETCPVWPGKPILAHWGSPDPAAFEGTEKEKQRFFVDVALQISGRVNLLCALPRPQIDAFRLQAIGQRARLENESNLAR